MGRPYIDTQALEAEGEKIWATYTHIREEFQGRKTDFQAWLRAAGRGQIKQVKAGAVTTATRPEKK